MTKLQQRPAEPSPLVRRHCGRRSSGEYCSKQDGTDLPNVAKRITLLLYTVLEVVMDTIM